MELLEAAVIGTGWCGGIRAETLARSALCKKLHVCEIRPDRLAEVKALHALTLFHRGITRWGFEVLPVREWWLQVWFTAWHRLLMARDHPRGWAHIRENREKLVTRHIWLSRAGLIRKYGASDAAAPAPAAPAASRPARLERSDR